MSARCLLASALALALCRGALAGDASETATPAPTLVAPDVKVGDRWDYVVHSDLHGLGGATTLSYVVKDASAGKIEAEVRTHRSSGDPDKVVAEVFDSCWRVLEEPNGKFVAADAASGALPSIAVGKEWTSQTYWAPKYSSLRFKWTEHGRVSAWESVKLADGKTYDAFKIETRRESEPGEGSGIQIVQAGTTTHKYVERNVEWYAPAVNRVIKGTFEASSDGKVVQSLSEELTSYKRGP